MSQPYLTEQETVDSAGGAHILMAEWRFVFSNRGERRIIGRPKKRSVTKLQVSSVLFANDTRAADLKLARQRMDQPDGPTWQEVKKALGL